MTSRRTFLKYSAVAAGSAFIGFPAFGFASTPTGRSAAIAETVFQRASAEGWEGLSIGEVTTHVGRLFLGSPYKPHTLEVGGTERLVVNLREFDCVTFVESSLALARCIKLHMPTFDQFTRQLQVIRYRGGILDGYPSRLHYFSDWIDDNEKKGIVKNIALDLGGVPFQKKITFMSDHRPLYRQLKRRETFDAIKKTEAELKTRQHYYLPKHLVWAAADAIHEGDVLGITTATTGLDISHTGFACRVESALHFLHAPLSAGTVQISTRTLADHLKQSDGRTGIMIARPLEPKP
jgi:hypothetical protein